LRNIIISGCEAIRCWFSKANPAGDSRCGGEDQTIGFFGTIDQKHKGRNRTLGGWYYSVEAKKNKRKIKVWENIAPDNQGWREFIKYLIES